MARTSAGSDNLSTAYPALVAPRLLDAVLAAQLANGGQPVPAELARTAAARPVAPTARDFTRIARKVAQLGQDERGRCLVHAGTDRNGTALWWVDSPDAEPTPAPAPRASAAPDPREVAIVRRALALARPGEDALDVLSRSLTGLEPSAPPAAQPPPVEHPPIEAAVPAQAPSAAAQPEPSAPAENPEETPPAHPSEGDKESAAAQSIDPSPMNTSTSAPTPMPVTSTAGDLPTIEPSPLAKALAAAPFEPAPEPERSPLAMQALARLRGGR
jgi:hypothetical protein